MGAAAPKEPPEGWGTPGTLPALLAARAADRATYPAVSWRATDGGTTVLTWQQYRALVLDVAAGYLRLGLEPGRTVAILAGNRVEHLAADLAASHCGAPSVSLYQTLSTEQLDHVVGDAEPQLIVVEEGARERIEKVPWVRKHAPHLIVLPERTGGSGTVSPESAATPWADLLASGAGHRAALAQEIERRVGALKPDDPLTYIYTSGTTGLSKGVTLTHHNLLWDARAMVRTGAFDRDYRAISSLPLAHVAERLWSIYVSLELGGHIYCLPDTKDLLDALTRHRPSTFMAVPRVWEKLAQGAKAFLDSSLMDAHRQALEADRATLAEQWGLRVDDAPVPARLRTAAELAREGVLREVRATFGLERAVACCGAAPLREDVAAFFASLGIYIHNGYGLTETAGVSVGDRLGGQSRGSVGLPLHGAHVRIAQDGEIELKSPGNTPGYRNLPDATAALYTADGWLRTGDIGHLDDAGRLHITDRKKEIIVNAAGKNIAPTGIESLIAGRDFVDLAMVVGEARPYVVALLSVDHQALTAFAAAEGIAETSVDALLDHPAVRARAQKIVDEANSRLSRPEQIKRFVLLPSAWTAESGELTPSLKMRRSVIRDRYQDQIEALYQQA
ncbi:AMP-dependent synthetase/ligase [Streptomyces diastatochromogenes]|uniref:AMP-dependent synthetase/ligase n=1 Tax=Streptomyces diastatochromogenes TaxID=42236 RepID=UPI0036A48610